MLTDLITRLETAPGNDRALFEEAHNAIYAPEGYCPPHRLYPSPIALQFMKMLDAQAWESAVRMLLPEGWHTGHYSQGPSGKPHTWALRTIGEQDQRYTEREATAHTEANAFASACLKAKEQSNG